MLKALALGAAAFLAGAAATHAAPPERPNIVWLTVEDMSPWLGCYGDRTAPTPNIDRLAREGVRYTNAFATTPVCAPARHTLITGMYATSTGALHMRNGTRSEQAFKRSPHLYDDIPLYEAVPPAGVRCFPEFLRLAGYYCTNNVKTDYQFNPPVTAWDASSRQAHWRNRGEGQPFFAVFNCTFTHESQAFPKAEKRADTVKLEDVPVPPYYPDTPAVRKTLAQTYNNIVAMDAWVGQRLAELEADGLLDSTIVVFFSDHGVGLPRGKRAMYDSGMRVPLVVRYPDGRRAGTTEDRLVSFIDFAPSVLSLAGVEPPAYMRGVPFLGESSAPAPQYVFATLDRVDVLHDRMRAVRDTRYKYVRNFRPNHPYIRRVAYRDQLEMMPDFYALQRPGASVTPEQWQIAADRKAPEEFYDTQADPHEVRNLIDDPQHAERINAMRAALDAWVEETRDLGEVLPETKLLKDALWPPDGVQPTTATPAVDVAKAGDGRQRLTVRCETDGASIGYRRPGEKGWAVYGEPIEVGADETVEIVAHRIGYKPSAVTSVPSTQPAGATGAARAPQPAAAE